MRCSATGTVLRAGVAAVSFVISQINAGPAGRRGRSGIRARTRATPPGGWHDVTAHRTTDISPRLKPDF